MRFSVSYAPVCTCVHACAVDLLVTRMPGLVEIPSKSAVKSLSVLYYRLVSRIAESVSNRSALYEPDVNGALIGAPLREKPDSRNRHFVQQRTSGNPGVISPLDCEISFPARLVFDLTSDQDLDLKFRGTKVSVF